MMKKSPKLLTEVELEMMQVLWRLGGGTVNDVLNELSKTRKLAYTSVSTMLRILEQKRALTSEKEGRGHVYTPTTSKQEYEEKSIKHLLNKVFDGEPTQLVRALLDVKGLTESELKEIKSLLNQR